VQVDDCCGESTLLKGCMVTVRVSLSILRKW
jgi:hypothetical protein